MIKAGIIGSTGYAGNELVRLLMGHPEVEVVWYGSRSYVEEKYANIYRNMFKLIEDKCLDDNIEKLSQEVDVIFTATPQGYLAGVLQKRYFLIRRLLTLVLTIVSKMLLLMRNGMELLTRAHSLLKKQCTAFVKLTVTRSKVRG